MTDAKTQPYCLCSSKERSLLEEEETTKKKKKSLPLPPLLWLSLADLRCSFANGRVAHEAMSHSPLMMLIF